MYAAGSTGYSKGLVRPLQVGLCATKHEQSRDRQNVEEQYGKDNIIQSRPFPGQFTDDKADDGSQDDSNH
jgi:hypothetical protein